MILAAGFATMVAWWNLGLPRVVFSSELTPIWAAASGTAISGKFGYIEAAAFIRRHP